MTKHVRIYKRGDRGFHGYGLPFTCTRGATVEVHESSSAEGAHVWLRLVAGDSGTGEGDVSAHLDAPQARALIARLQTWLDEIPARWRGRRGA